MSAVRSALGTPTHVKRQIQHCLRDALQAHLPVTAAYLDRFEPLPARRCPAALLRESEAGERMREVTQEGLQRRDLLVDVALCVSLAASEDHGDAVALLGLQAEMLIAADLPERAPEIQRLHGLCPLGIELRASRTFFSGEGEEVVAVQRQVWQFSYAVDPARPDVAIT